MELGDDDHLTSDTSAKNGTHLTFIEEAQSVLCFMNATPFKPKTSKLYCIYCSTEGPMFESPDDLRQHTEDEHGALKIRNLELALRPAWSNEVLRVDIHNLQCTECEEPIETWEKMYEHLKDTHNLTFQYAHNKLIPYILNDQDYRCPHCDKRYHTYNLLDSHMNSHYPNYICLECGDPFLSESRLKMHGKTHDVGKFPCEVCGKIFTLDKYRKKHYNLRHEPENKNKCVYCDEKFHADYQKHVHMLEKHKEKVKTITCEICGRAFTWRPYYLKHIREKHTKKSASKQKSKEYQCKYCVQKFTSIAERRAHCDDAHQNKKAKSSNDIVKLLRSANDVLVRKEMKKQLRSGRGERSETQQLMNENANACFDESNVNVVILGDDC